MSDNNTVSHQTTGPEGLTPRTGPVMRLGDLVEVRVATNEERGAINVFTVQGVVTSVHISADTLEISISRTGQV